MGGSLALALRKYRPNWTVRIWARSTATAARMEEHFPDVTTDPALAARKADLCVLCTPVSAMPALAEAIAPHLSTGAVVTDAGSTKAGVVKTLERILPDYFIGSHPMAGSDRSGFDAAQADLFEDAVTILTPTARTPKRALAIVRDLWTAIGSRVVEMSPQAHDEAVARVSHLPHAAAAALVHAISPDGRANLDLAGGGYRDSTRIAASPPRMWAEIFLENQSAVLAGLHELTSALEELSGLIRDGDAPAVEAFLARAKTTREHLP